MAQPFLQCHGCTQIRNHRWCRAKLFQETYKQLAHNCPCHTCLVKTKCTSDCELRIETIRKYVRTR